MAEGSNEAEDRGRQTIRSTDIEEFGRLLSELGLEEKPARVVAFLAGVGQGRSADLETACSLRQPEVSQATKVLRERGWVVARREKRPGKGRPVNNYRLRISLDDLVNEIEGTRREEINRELARIERLRSLVDQASRTEAPAPASR